MHNTKIKPVVEIDSETLAACGKFFHTHNLKLLCAESMTAGYLSALWSLEFHSGNYFLGSLICYNDRCKTQLLSVPEQKIEKYCAESAVITLRMLDGLSKKPVPEANVFISVTGLAFKTNNAKQKREIGTVYYAFQYEKEKKIYKKRFVGEPAEIFVHTCNSLLADLNNWLPIATKKPRI